MSRSAMRGVVCLTVCLLATSAMAQQGQGRGRGGFGGGFGGGGLLFLTGWPEVQTELKLSDEQKGKLQTLREDAMAALRGGGGGGGRALFDPNATEEERQKAREAQQKATDEQNTKVLAILSADQGKRAKELGLQQRLSQGMAGALSSSDLVKEFKITDSQLGSLKTIADGQRSQTMELFQGAGGGGFSPENQTKMAEIRTNADKEVTAILSADQKSAIEKAKGAKFEFPAFGAGRGRRGNNN